MPVRLRQRAPARASSNGQDSEFPTRKYRFESGCSLHIPVAQRKGRRLLSGRAQVRVLPGVQKTYRRVVQGKDVCFQLRRWGFESLRACQARRSLPAGPLCDKRFRSPPRLLEAGASQRSSTSQVRILAGGPSPGWSRVIMTRFSGRNMVCNTVVPGSIPGRVSHALVLPEAGATLRRSTRQVRLLPGALRGRAASSSRASYARGRRCKSSPRHHAASRGRDARFISAAAPVRPRPQRPGPC